MRNTDTKTTSRKIGDIRVNITSNFNADTSRRIDDILFSIANTKLSKSQEG